MGGAGEHRGRAREGGENWESTEAEREGGRGEPGGIEAGRERRRGGPGGIDARLEGAANRGALRQGGWWKGGLGALR